ncbi:MAG: IS21 family transposase [Proteobacteria bacterium]|nr:IS21 family transposase [Pseudomonadota bacterium]
MMSPEEIAEARRLFFGEHWKIGTISTHLGRHTDAIRRALNADSFSRKGRFVPRMIDPYIGFIEETLETYPKVCATRIYEMIVSRGFTGSIGQTRRAVRRLRPRASQEAYLRLKTLPGEQGQVDWANFGYVQVGNAKRLLSAFVMVLSWSRALHAVFTLDQKTDNFLFGHVGAFKYFRGIPRVLLYDNLKSAVIERLGKAIHFNPRLLEFSSHYHYEPRPVAVARGNEKGRVERAIRFLRDRFFAARQFRDVEDLNEQFEHWRKEWAHARPCPGNKQLTVAEALEQERDVLMPLPEHPFNCETIHIVKSGKTPYVRFDLNDYSIPYELVRKPLSIYSSNNTIRIFDDGKEVARHDRSYDRDQTIEKPEHISALAEFKHSARQSREMTRLFENVGCAKTFLEQVVERSENLAAATRQLERLLDEYGAVELSAAVEEALKRGTTAPSAVVQVLEQERRKQRMKPPVRVKISNDPRANDLRISKPKLEDYDDLAK